MYVDGAIMIYVTTDKPLYGAGSAAIIRIRASNEEDRELSLTAKVTASLNDKKLTAEEGRMHLLRGEGKIMEFQVDLPEPGVLTVNADVDYDGKSVSDSVRAYVLEPGKRIRLALVYHMHQPPWYLPSGVYYADYAFKYVHDGLLAPFFDGGPYMFHAHLNERHEDVKVNANISPSLLRQWMDAADRGYALMDGRAHGRDSFQASKVREVLDLFRLQAHRGQVEVLTSLYAHTIAGYLISSHGMADVIEEEVAAGMEITKTALGINPIGVWTPEMAWDMPLAGIYSKVGLRYTVLCGKNHFPGSAGDKSTIYEPYDLDGFTVFFRDQRISDTLAFENNLFDARHADRVARRAIMEAARADGNDPIVVVALDGENFMAMSKTPALVAMEMDFMYSYIEALQRDGTLATIRLSDVLSESKRRLTFIPTTTWLGGFSKWRGERAEHEHYWLKAVDSYRFLLGAEQMLRRKLPTARNAIWHALDSDFWWSDFWNGYIIDEWLKKSRAEVINSLSRVQARLERDHIETIINASVNIGIHIINETGGEVSIDIVCCRDLSSHLMGPGESVIRVSTTPTVAGEYSIPIIISARGYGYKVLYQSLSVKAFP